MLPAAIAQDARLYVEPIGISLEAPGGRPLAGGPLRFNRVRVSAKTGGEVLTAAAGLGCARRWAAKLGPPHDRAFEQSLERLIAPRPALPGTRPHRPLLMGIVNVTPDSFSDGGEHFAAEAAIARAHQLADDGADILDIGGESTRPGASEVDAVEEWRRVGPVLHGLRALALPLSIDSRHAPVIGQALNAGAGIVNDVSGFRHQPLGLALALSAGATIVLMHSRGAPGNMRHLTHYQDVALDVYDDLATLLRQAVAAGVQRERIVLDPGIGFAKTPEQNFELLRRLALFHALGQPLMVGASRKSFLGALSDGAPPKGRVAASLATAIFAAAQGAHVLRVHDVRETRQALAAWRVLLGFAS